MGLHLVRWGCVQVQNFQTNAVDRLKQLKHEIEKLKGEVQLAREGLSPPLHNIELTQGDSPQTINTPHMLQVLSSIHTVPCKPWLVGIVLRNYS